MNSLPLLVMLRSRFGQRLGRLGYLGWIVVLAPFAVLHYFLIFGRPPTPMAELDPLLRAAWWVGRVVFSTLSVYLGVRRLHDFNRSGWWYLPIFSVPLLLPDPYGGYANSVSLFALLLLPGTNGANRYGVRRVAKGRADDDIPTLDGRPPRSFTDDFDEPLPLTDPDEKGPG